MPITFGNLTYQSIEEVPMRRDRQGTHVLDKRGSDGRWWGIYMRRNPRGLFKGDPLTFANVEAQAAAERRPLSRETETVIDKK